MLSVRWRWREFHVSFTQKVLNASKVFTSILPCKKYLVTFIMVLVTTYSCCQRLGTRHHHQAYCSSLLDKGLSHCTPHRSSLAYSHPVLSLFFGLRDYFLLADLANFVLSYLHICLSYPQAVYSRVESRRTVYKPRPNNNENIKKEFFSLVQPSEVMRIRNIFFIPCF